MAGGKRPHEQCSSKSLEAAAGTGDRGPMKRKVKAGRRKDRATGRKNKETAAGTSATGAAATEIPPGARPRMSNREIRWILAKKPMAACRDWQLLKQRNPDLTPRPGEVVDDYTRRQYVLAKAFFEMEERLPHTQVWVREELRTKGYVEVAEEWVKERAKAQSILDTIWPAIQAKLDSETEDEDDDDSDDYSDDDD